MSRSFLVLIPIAGALLTHASAGTIVVSKGGAFPTIQSGIDAALAGDTVLVDDGFYEENVTIPNSKTGLTLSAAGAVVIDAHVASNLNGTGPGITVLATNVLLKGLTIQNAKESGANAANGDGIRVLAGPFTAKSCRVLGCEDAGIRLVDADDSTLQNCRLEGCDLGLGGADVETLIVKKCVFRGGQEGVILDSCANVSFTACSFSYWTNSAIASKFQSPSSSVTVGASAFDSIGRVAIDLDATNTLIQNCSFREGSFGVVIDGGPSTLRENVFFRTVDDGGGIFLRDANLAIVEGNTFEFLSDQGIGIDDCEDVEVRDNRISIVACEGESALSIEGSNGIVANNECEDCVGTGIDFQDGEVVAFDNRVRRATRDGIIVSSSAVNTVLLGNIVDRCGAEGLDHRGANSDVRDNVFKKCRLDLTNSGTGTFTDNKFKTGGTNVPFDLD